MATFTGESLTSSLQRTFAILALIAGVFLAVPAAAGDLIVSRGVLEDAAGTLSISDVATREFTPTGALFSGGFTTSVHWLRIQVKAPESAGKVVLYIRQPFLNDVRLYEADAGDPSGWKMRVTGSHHPYAERDRAAISLGFVVHVPAPEAIYYLRLKTRSTSEISVEALSPAEAEDHDHWTDLLEVFFVSSMAALLLWAVHSYLVDRVAVVGLFALHQAAYILFGVAATGYLAPLAPAAFPEFVDGLTAVLYCGIGFTALLFCRALFKPYRPPPLLMRGFDMFLLAIPVELAAVALGQAPFALMLGFVLIRVTWWYFVLVAFCLRQEQEPSRRIVQIFFVVITLANNAHWLARSWGPADVNGWQTLIGNGLVIGSLFAILLHKRSRRLLLEGQRAALDLLLAQSSLEAERRIKEQAVVQARTDYLTGLFNRRHFIELSEQEVARAVRYDRPLSLLMIDIDHFKAINDTWGHGAGDAVLQEVARLIRSSLRDVDIVGRIGGEEFAAVLVETGAEPAMEAAERLRAKIADAAIPAPGGEPLRVTISLGATERNGRDIDIDFLLHEADRALYRAKEGGRNRAVSHG